MKEDEWGGNGGMYVRRGKRTEFWWGNMKERARFNRGVRG
jgi:hypothetical protein